MDTKNILLLRHAKSDWNIEVEDWLRPLKKRGVKAAKAMGHWMSEQLLLPDLIISSPAKRAISTAKKISKALGLNGDIIRQDERVYNATTELLLEVLRECPVNVKRVLVVGHNPSLEDFLSDLVKSPIDLPEDGKLMPTAALAELSFSGAWTDLKRQKAVLDRLTRVKSIQVD